MDNTIINELTQGMELAKQLRVNLSSKSSPEARDVLIQKILSSYDKALLILKWSVDSAAQPPVESTVSVDESPRSGDFDLPSNDPQDERVVCKKRKALATWADRICTEDGLEGHTEDGHSWRKYGQKDILGARFPRSYYRCTYRSAQNCLARKQVQRTDEDPTAFEIVYKGKHTCNHAAMMVPPQPSPEKHETKQTHHHHLSPSNSGEMLSNLKVNTSDLATFSFPSPSFGVIENYQGIDFLNQVSDDLLLGYSPSFISPVTSGSNYFTEWGNDLNSNLTSPLTFAVDPVDLDPNFPFNNSFF